jgi:hypothetical protein
VARGRDLFWSPLVAAALALLAVLVGLRGVDLPAQLYRVDLFHRAGLTLWDNHWYGGHWTLNYSVIFPPLAGLVGVGLTEVASATVAAWMFDRLAVGHFGKQARAGSLVFALGTLAQVAIGQLPFLLGEALALSACLMIARRRWAPAVALAFATPLASPLAGAFLALALVAWLAATWRDARPARALPLAAALGAAGLPAVALSALFPGQGLMPFPALDCVWLLVLFAAAGLVVPSRWRGLRLGAVVYLAAIVVSFVISTPVGGNVSRLGECVGAPLVLCALWPRRRLLAISVALPIAALQWGPALSTFVSNGSDPSTKRAYFQPLIGFLARHQSPIGRVEVVPTKLHWEAAYVAASVPIARGWERQLDTADNPIFYTLAALNPDTYTHWLTANGVRYVALPDVPLDYAGKAEAALIRTRLPALRRVWHNAHWQVFAVRGSTGIVSGPAQLVSLNGSSMVLDASGPGVINVHVRYSAGWTLASGQGCVRQAADGSTTIDGASAGRLQLGIRLGGGAEAPGQRC